MSENSLQLGGDLSAQTFGELLKDIASHDISGVFRLTSERQKIVVYITGGKPVLAAANMKSLRLLEIISRLKFVAPQNFFSINPNTPDAELAKILLENNLIREDDLRSAHSDQLRMIIETALRWTSGEWHFNPLVRIAEGSALDFDSSAILMAAAQRLTTDFAASRITDNETFVVAADFPRDKALSPTEAFLLSRLEGISSFGDISKASGLPSAEVAKSLYSLWFGGFVRRFGWKNVFTEDVVRRIGTANFRPSEQKKVFETKAPVESTSVADLKTQVVENADSTQKIETLQEFFVRMDVAQNHYQVLGVERDADFKQIKASYFRLAKTYHPDKFHNSESATNLSRIENAFSMIARAYDALKDEESRKLYDFKLRRAENADSEGTSVRENPQTGEDFFRNGAIALQQENFPQAVANFSQAIRFEPNNAKFHAFYGKALSANPKFRHQAESELTNAIRIEPNNTEYRLMLVEFYRSFGLIKRAQGELNRIFTIDPNNAQAREILDNLE